MKTGSFLKKLGVIAIAGTMLAGMIIVTVPQVVAIGDTPYSLEAPSVAIDDTKIVLTWDKPDDYHERYGTAGAITDYEVFQNGTSLGRVRDNMKENYLYLDTFMKSFYDQSKTENLEHYEVDLHSFTVTKLAPNTAYSFTVRAVYKDGTCSEQSTPVSAKTTNTTTIVNVNDYGITPRSHEDAGPEVGSSTYRKAGAGDDPGVIAEIQSNTKKLQKAIDDCPIGGKVILPGTGDNAAPIYYVSGSLFLHTDMTFEIQKGAVLLGSPNFDDYPRSLLVYPYSQDIRTYGVLNAVSWDLGQLKNVRIVGEGALDGNGWHYATTGSRQNKQDFDPDQGMGNPNLDPTGNEWKLYNYVAGSSGNVGVNGILAADSFNKSQSDVLPNGSTSKSYNTRPNLTVTRGVQGIYYEGLTFYNPAFHGIVNYQSEDIVCNGVVMQTYNTNNGDGIEFGDCLDITVMNSFFDTGDDAINFAAGQGATMRNEGDRVASGEGKVFNSFVRNGHGGLLAMGSHTAGFIGDMIAEDNLLHSCETGNNGALRLKTGATTGGGIRNILLQDTAIHYSLPDSGKNATIIVDTAYSDSNASTAFSPESEFAVIYENIIATNLTVSNLNKNLISVTPTGRSGIAVDPILRNFNFSDINVLSGTGGNISVGSNTVPSLIDSALKNIKHASNTPTVSVNGTKNLTIDNVYNIANNQTPDHLSWGASDMIDSTVTGHSIALTWPIPAGGTPAEYVVLVKQDDAYREVTRTKSTGATITLAPETTYDIAIRAENATSATTIQENMLKGKVTTLTTSDVMPKPELPADTVINGRTGEDKLQSGMSWQNLRWRPATDAAGGGIAYYNIVATPSGNGPPKKFRVYFDHEIRGGYALWGLDGGVSYDVTLTAVNWAGVESDPYDSFGFTTVPSTHNDIPKWQSASVLRTTGAKIGDDTILSWNADDITDDADGTMAQFAGYRISLSGSVIAAQNGSLIDQVNAIPTTRETSYAIQTDQFLPNIRYPVSVEAGDEILKIASGSGGFSGASDFRGTANLDKQRNHITFGKWTAHGPTTDLFYPTTITKAWFGQKNGAGDLPLHCETYNTGKGDVVVTFTQKVVGKQTVVKIPFDGTHTDGKFTIVVPAETVLGLFGTQDVTIKFFLGDEVISEYANLVYMPHTTSVPPTSTPSASSPNTSTPSKPESPRIQRVTFGSLLADGSLPIQLTVKNPVKCDVFVTFSQRVPSVSGAASSTVAGAVRVTIPFDGTHTDGKFTVVVPAETVSGLSGAQDVTIELVLNGKLLDKIYNLTYHASVNSRSSVSSTYSDTPGNSDVTNSTGVSIGSNLSSSAQSGSGISRDDGIHAPKTGDDIRVFLFLFVFGMGLSFLGIILIKRKS